MALLQITTVSTLVSFTLACSSGQSADPAPAPPALPAKTVFDPMTRQLDRARDVQNTVDANSAATRKSVDEQERGDSTP